MTWQELLRRLGLTDAQILRLTGLIEANFPNPFPALRRPEIVPTGKGGGTLNMLDRVFGRPEGLDLSPEERGTQPSTMSDVISDITGGGIGGTLGGTGSGGGAGSATGSPFEDIPPLPPELPEESYGMGGGWTAF